jgi:hypothetical protein
MSGRKRFDSNPKQFTKLLFKLNLFSHLKCFKPERSKISGHVAKSGAGSAGNVQVAATGGMAKGRQDRVPGRALAYPACCQE